MPNESPLEIGDEPYPELNNTDRNIIKDGVTVIKGHIYTNDSEGRMIVPVSTSSVADLTKGKMQAKAAAADPGAEDTDDIQVLKPFSRILLKADANLVPGQDVDLKSSGSTTTADKCMAGVSPHGKGHLGKIWRIYTKGTDGARKQKTSDNDLVEIDMEVS